MKKLITKKVLHIFNSIEYSGAETMLLAAAPFFKANGFEIIALSTGINNGSYSEKFQNNHIKVFHIPFQRERSLKYLVEIVIFSFKYYKLIMSTKVDIVHIHKAHFFGGIVILSKIAGVKAVVRTIHAIFCPPFYRWFQHFISRKIARFLDVKMISISQSVYMNEKHHFNNLTILINNWYNPKIFYKMNKKAELRLKLGLPLKAFLLISVGSCQKLKRHLDIIELMKELTKISDIDVRYVHVGKGPLLEKEKRIAKEYDIESLIYFVGNTTDVNLFLNASDAFVMPSDHEGLGIAAIEAMACKLPVFIYDVPGLIDLYDGKNMLVTKKGDIDDLLTKILTLAYSSNASKRLGENAASFVKENFNINKNTKLLFKLYHAII